MLNTAQHMKAKLNNDQSVNINKRNLQTDFDRYAAISKVKPVAAKLEASVEEETKQPDFRINQIATENGKVIDEYMPEAVSGDIGRLPI